MKLCPHIATMAKKTEGAADEDIYQVFFSVDKVLPLIGSGEEK